MSPVLLGAGLASVGTAILSRGIKKSHSLVNRHPKNKKGVCDITADGVAMCMMLLRNAIGVSTYNYHTNQTIRTLRATAEGQRIHLNQGDETWGVRSCSRLWTGSNSPGARELRSTSAVKLPTDEGG